MLLDEIGQHVMLRDGVGSGHQGAQSLLHSNKHDICDAQYAA